MRAGFSPAAGVELWEACVHPVRGVRSKEGQGELGPHSFAWPSLADLGLFSTKTLVEASEEHTVECAPRCSPRMRTGI